MQTKDIQPNEWRQFFDSFTRKHRDALVGLEIFGPEIGAQTQETGLSLQGIIAERTRALGHLIIIMLGAKAGDHITHSIDRATNVNLEQDDNGADVALAIKGADGVTALLRFQSAVLPEVADAGRA